MKTPLTLVEPLTGKTCYRSVVPITPNSIWRSKVLCIAFNTMHNDSDDNDHLSRNSRGATVNC